MALPPDLSKLLPTKVVEQAYSDAVSDTLKEVSKIGVDAAKTVRLILFPLQFTAAFQDRLARYIDRAVRSVPAERRVAPVESLALQVADRLRFQEDGNVVTDMYVSLLARAMDRQRAGEAHPAFVHLVGQLAPDEALLIEQIATAGQAAYMRSYLSAGPFTKEQREQAIERSALRELYRERLSRMWVRPEKLSQPELVFTYIEHLHSLGIMVYNNDRSETGRLLKGDASGVEYWLIELNEFGRLFHAACLSDRPDTPA